MGERSWIPTILIYTCTSTVFWSAYQYGCEYIGKCNQQIHCQCNVSGRCDAHAIRAFSQWF